MGQAHPFPAEVLHLIEAVELVQREVLVLLLRVLVEGLKYAHGLPLRWWWGGGGGCEGEGVRVVKATRRSVGREAMYWSCASHVTHVLLAGTAA